MLISSTLSPERSTAASAPRESARARPSLSREAATTRPAPGGGYVRDPFTSTCPTSTTVYSLANCPDLNQIPAGRIDPNAVNLLNLYPNPTSPGLLNNFASSPSLYEHKNSFDIRGDYNPEEKDQIFFRYSFSDDPQFIPGPFGGIADGGAFQEGDQSARSCSSSGVPERRSSFRPIGWTRSRSCSSKPM